MFKRVISALLSVLMFASVFACLTSVTSVPVRAVTANQQRIVDRANYLYDIKWDCKKTISGWRGQYTFYAGSSYRLPYGQPIYAGAYIGYGVSVDNFIAATKNASSVFYTSQSNYNGWYSTYYATDCSAYVSWAWGIDRKTTYSIPQVSTNLGYATTANINSKLQLGDCLNSNSVGHVVLVTGITYNSSGAISQIEITEQTPPQLKRSTYTPSSLGAAYGGYYTIQRYTGTVPESPGGSSSVEPKYYNECDDSYETFYAAMDSIGVPCDWDLHCRIAAKNGITDFTGTVEQNTQLLNLLKEGMLLNPDYSGATFDFKFYPNSGTGSMPNQTVAYGDHVKINANTFTREGYEFGGWRAYQESTDRWRYTNGTKSGWYKKDEQPVGYYYYVYRDGQTVGKTGSGTKDIVRLYAVWIKHDYTIKYFANGGTGTMADSKHTYGLYSCLSENKFTRNGYTFAGWYVNRPNIGEWMYSNGVKKTGYIPGTQPDGYAMAVYVDQQNITSVCAEDNVVYCYAQWVPDSTGTTTYYVDYNSNGGSGEMQRQPIVYGTSTKTTANAFVREGYEFAGWKAHRRSDNKWIFVDSAGESKWMTAEEYAAATAGAYSFKVYHDTAAISKTSSVDKDIVTFYALWSAASYTVTFKDHDGTVLSTQKVAHGKSAVAPAAPSRADYIFKGWDADYSNITNDVTITALYEEIRSEFTVTFADYDGTVINTVLVDKGGAATAPEAPARSADVNYVYTFAGWDKSFNNVTTDITVTATYNQTPQVYFIRGSFNDWGTTDQMTPSGNGIYKATKSLEAGYYEFKAANEDWSMEWPLGTNQNVTLANDSKVTFTLDTLNHRLTLSTEAIVIEYTVTFKDYNGTVISTQSVVKGGAATAPEKPVREGYTFTGWDVAFDNITSDTTVTAQYTKDAVYGNLKVEMAGGTGFTLSINDGVARPQGWFYLNSRIATGTKITIVAQNSAGNDFIGWVSTDSNKILTTDTAYTFYTGGNDSLRALYVNDFEDVSAVIFKNDKSKQILDMQYYAAGDSIFLPADTMYVGYDFAGWSLTVDEIQSKLEAGEDVYVVPNWTVKQVYVAVDVTNGTVTGYGGINAEGKYLAAKQTTVVADAAASGEKFAYWTDANGKVKSYDATYSFYPAVDTALTAVYVGENETIDYQILANMDACDTSGTYGTFYMSWYVPEGYTFMGSGLVAANKDNYKEDTFYHGTTDSNVWDRASSGTSANGTFTWTGPVMSGQTWCAKAWVQYKDLNGDTIVVYSDMFEVTKL